MNKSNNTYDTFANSVAILNTTRNRFTATFIDAPVFLTTMFASYTSAKPPNPLIWPSLMSFGRMKRFNFVMSSLSLKHNSGISIYIPLSLPSLPGTLRLLPTSTSRINCRPSHDAILWRRCSPTGTARVVRHTAYSRISRK